jgi:hypothetical protein
MQQAAEQSFYIIGFERNVFQFRKDLQTIGKAIKKILAWKLFVLSNLNQND